MLIHRWSFSILVRLFAFPVWEEGFLLSLALIPTKLRRYRITQRLHAHCDHWKCELFICGCQCVAGLVFILNGLWMHMYMYCNAMMPITSLPWIAVHNNNNTFYLIERYVHLSTKLNIVRTALFLTIYKYYKNSLVQQTLLNTW